MPARVECEAYSDSSMMGDAPVERGVANGADGTTIPMVARDPSGQLSNNVLYKVTKVDLFTQKGGGERGLSQR